ncbi:hypothetical protein CXG81DRAFT_23495 [Caulochytrium protostelioides]|uniref:Uncharacterized protein n=1 Tax=Caulochytrium protostelioides TaxID=1555241 RepID=A0A4P9XEG2_9FUNG|nr:hypothetical protein CXG81DRAFT_23495 [Caulochytrium protostelioides]|eukprot:RKP03937.1 hypothetical protein CXG81DRAFT_23495 [Caulochytrium protostelioides]
MLKTRALASVLAAGIRDSAGVEARAGGDNDRLSARLAAALGGPHTRDPHDAAAMSAADAEADADADAVPSAITTAVLLTPQGSMLAYATAATPVTAAPHAAAWAEHERGAGKVRARALAAIGASVWGLYARGPHRVVPCPPDVAAAEAATEAAEADAARQRLRQRLAAPTLDAAAPAPAAPAGTSPSAHGTPASPARSGVPGAADAAPAADAAASTAAESGGATAGEAAPPPSAPSDLAAAPDADPDASGPSPAAAASELLPRDGATPSPTLSRAGGTSDAFVSAAASPALPGVTGAADTPRRDAAPALDVPPLTPRDPTPALVIGFDGGHPPTAAPGGADGAAADAAPPAAWIGIRPVTGFLLVLQGYDAPAAAASASVPPSGDADASVPVRAHLRRLAAALAPQLSQVNAYPA